MRKLRLKKVHTMIKHLITYVLISELRNYDFQTDVFLLINLRHCAPIVLLMNFKKSMSEMDSLKSAVCSFCLLESLNHNNNKAPVAHRRSCNYC